MPGLAETTARLVRERRQPRPRGRATRPRMVEVETFGLNPGGLRMLTYRPQDLAPDAPLVVTLHGCGQQAEVFAEQAGWLALADRFGFAVLAVEQSPSNNFNRCFNWFEPDDIVRDLGEAASIAAMVRHVVSTEGADPDRVYVTGLSAGGAMTAVMLAAYPDLFAAGAVVAGLPYGVARGVGEALGAMHGRGAKDTQALAERAIAAGPQAGDRPRITIWHGDADYTVGAGNAAALVSQWTSVHGLDEADIESESLPGLTRLRLRAAGSDIVLVESNIVHGLGHGTPLATTGPDALGATAPYMLEAGISSTLEIARFWGLAEAGEAASVPTRPGGAVTPAPPAPTAPPKTPELGDQVLSAVADHVSPAVRDVIANAMRAAGLKT